jgi:RNA polymerase sigma-70 factor (ECF subfamily)
MEEGALIASAQKGDLEAFNQLVLKYEQQAFRVALRITGEAGLAEDATQEGFIKAYRGLRSFRGGSFKAWILRIVSNACYDEIRRLARKPAVSLDAENETENEGPILWVEDPGEKPEDWAARLDLSKVIQVCIQELNRDFRDTLILIDVEGLNYAEAASATDSAVGTIRSRLARARKQVRMCLQAAGELLPENYRLEGEPR